ncbi:S-layer protein [Candidatus Woesearchaeota archaeon]|nr:S-layer protein [Candidatus Woesearchaeota archaeon]
MRAKKIVALATGTLMVGATILGAMAADLADYPKPLFIEDGKFNGAIVVGDRAAAEDVVGAIDIATSLQFSSTTSVTVETAEKTVVEGDAWQVSSKTEILELSENLTSVQSSIGKDELVALADGIFTNEKGDADYEQEIDISGDVEVAFTTDEDDVTSDFLVVDRGDGLGDFELTFKTDAESDIDTDTNELEDFEDESITMLGMDYTIVDTQFLNDAITLELMGGALLDTIEEGETKTYTLKGNSYEVVALIVSDTAQNGEGSVKLKVNGEVTDEMAEDDTFRLSDGTEVGIRSVMPNEAGEVTGGDIVEFYLGAQKIEMDDVNVTDSANGGTLKVGEETMDDAEIEVEGEEVTGAEFRLTGINIVYLADDDFYIAPGEKLSEQMEEPEALLNWDMAYEGLTTEPTQEIKIVGSGDDEYKLRAELADGDVSMPLAFGNATGLYLGDEDDRLVLSHASIEEDQYFILTTGYEQGEKSYVLQYLGADVPSGGGTATLKFKNLASGETIERSFDTDATVRLGGEEWVVTCAGTSVNCSEDDFNLTIDDGAEQVIVTTYDAQINISQLASPGVATVTIGPVDPSDMIDDVETSDNDIVVTVNVTTAEEVDIDIDAGGAGAAWQLESLEDEDNVEKAITPYGAELRYVDEEDDPDKLEIAWPNSQREAQAFITSGAVSVATVAGALAEGVSVEKIEVGTAKLASEITNVAGQNLLLVGGPCANDAAAEVMGISATVPECLAGFEAGKAMVKLYDTGAGNVAMLVAGATAEDTRRASRVIANFGDYALSGDEVEVTGVGLTSIQVTKVS